MKAFVQDVPAVPSPPEQTVTLTMNVQEFAALVLVVNASLSGMHPIRDGIRDGIEEARESLHPDWRERLYEAERTTSRDGNVTDRVRKAFLA